ncbi:YeeE/YedE family protein [Aduncisulcus paluster]|uniref:YeeE/YedE family protein n=1 Tax=Aduncisulcus paluster TaxID=2918883 RepID=A0ABQ5KGV1_9EUKA|nr:YeeE/YedE family protein [Aduncisulcus paluster]
MMIADGCSSRHLVKFAQGDPYSLVTLIFIGIFAILSLRDGVVVGLLVAIGWYITGVVGADSMEKEIAVASMSFVYPTAQTLEFFTYYQVTELSFGVSIILGVLSGGALMGVGGVLAIGCTVGQGLSGVSSLAVASVVAILSIMISAFITAKYLGKRDQLPMCFIFEWNDKKEEEAKRNFQI